MTIIIALLVGIVGGIFGTLIANRYLFGKIQGNDFITHKELEFMFDDFSNHVIIDIEDIRNDVSKAVWLDDLTIKGLNDRVDNLNKKVDKHFRWSLGVWNDISVLVDPKHQEGADKVEGSIDTVPVELDDNLRPMGPVQSAKIFVDSDETLLGMSDEANAKYEAVNEFMNGDADVEDDLDKPE